MTPGARWSINGAPSKAYDGPPLFQVKRGTPVTFGFVNRAEVAVVMHVHGHAVRLLHDLDDGWEPYWRNGVVVPPGKTKHVAFVADSPGKWAVHDDILEHEAPDSPPGSRSFSRNGCGIAQHCATRR